MQNNNNVIKALIPLTLMSMACVFADTQKTDMMKNNESQQRKLKEQETYNYSPRYYDLKDGKNGAFVTGDFLYWYARESNLEYAYENTFFNEPTGAATTRQFGYATKHHYVHSKWSPGFRAGLGWNTAHDGWDLYANYTYFTNHNKHSERSKIPQFSDADEARVVLSVDGIKNLNDPWANSDNTFPTGGAIEALTMDGKWRLVFNQLDLELGRKFWVSKTMALRPYVGVRGAKTHTNFTVFRDSSDPRVIQETQGDDIVIQGPSIETYKNKFKNRFWGVGLVGGIQPEFHFRRNIILFGNLDGSLLWGKFTGKNHVNFVSIFEQQISNDGGQTFREADIARGASPTENDHFTRMQGILDLAIGLRWEENWNNDSWRTSIDVGWEHHYWFDFGLYHRPIGGTANDSLLIENPNPPPPFLGPIFHNPQQVDNFVTNLGFGGLVVRARVDF